MLNKIKVYVSFSSYEQEDRQKITKKGGKKTQPYNNLTGFTSTQWPQRSLYTSLAACNRKHRSSVKESWRPLLGFLVLLTQELKNELKWSSRKILLEVKRKNPGRQAVELSSCLKNRDEEKLCLGSWHEVRHMVGKQATRWGGRL